MVGIIITLAVSWILLRFIAKKDLRVLGLIPTLPRLFYFIIGFAAFLFLNAFLLYVDSKIHLGMWNKNPDINFNDILHSLWYHFKSAFFEELVFRGAILYILVLKLGLRWGLIITSLAFGIYHWFSYGIFGSSVVLMTVVLVITGSMGFAWGWSYIKSRSLFLPLGMHLGWNFCTSLIAEGKPYGKLIYFVSEKQEMMNQWVNLIYHISKGILPALIVFFIIRYYFKGTGLADNNLNPL